MTRGMFRNLTIALLSCSSPLLAGERRQAALPVLTEGAASPEMVVLPTSSSTDSLAPVARRGAGGSPSNAYGTVDSTLVVIAGPELTARSSATGWTVTDGRLLNTGANGDALFFATLKLDSGVKLDTLYLEACDSDGTNNVTLSLFSCPIDFTCGAATSTLSTSATPGCTTVSLDVSAMDITIDNAATTYLLQVAIPGTVNSVRSVAASYLRQVAPAPAIPTFGDVSQIHPFYQYIEALASAAITGGCGSGNYCPDAPLTRGQMAVFLSKALGLHFAP